MSNAEQMTAQSAGRIGPLPSHLMVFDGVCILCSRAVQFIARHDRRGVIHFTIAQSPLGQSLMQANGLNPEDFESHVVIVDGVTFLRLDGVIALARELGWPWRIAGILRPLPQGVKDWLYERIAKNRYAIFGRKESCDIPPAGLRERLI